MRSRLAQASALVQTSVVSQCPPENICLQQYRRITLHQQDFVCFSKLYHAPRRRSQSTFAAAVRVAQIFKNGSKDTNLPGGVQIDPFRTVAKEMKFLTKNIQQLLGSDHPVLDTVAKYYTQSEGKHIRPMLVLLMSQATSHCPQSSQVPYAYSSAAVPINTPISPANILLDANPSFPSALPSPERNKFQDSSDSILSSQRRLAEITELIHTASLLHDDVIDHSVSRRSQPSANIAFGNKMAVLAGDFLLGRASVALARLRSPEVTELLATVIANLIEGEFMQLRNTVLDEAYPVFSDSETIPYYLQKTYLKSASLISKSCRAAALLGNASQDTVEAAYAYGKNLGLAFQLVDDMLDFTRTEAELGKPAGADLELGLATAPLLFAWKGNSELGKLVGRKFGKDGDVRRVGHQQRRTLQSYS